MTKIALLFICVLAGSKLQAQKKEKVKIRDIIFTAKEVTGKNTFTSAWSGFYTSLGDPIEVPNENFYYSVGSYRPDYRDAAYLDLFNLSTQNGNFPFLDSIDFDYYKSVSLSKLENSDPKLSTRKSYRLFKEMINSNLPIRQKRAKLFSEDFDEFRKLLLATRFEIPLPKSFTVDKTKVSKMTAELKANLDTISLNTTSEIAAKIRLYISRLSDQATHITGYYWDVRLDPAYISKIDYYITTTPKVTLANDQFAHNLKKYMESEDAAANTSLVAIRLAGSFDRSKISADSVSADLSSKFNLSQTESKRIAASINFVFTKNETTIFKVKFDNTWILRYFTSNIINDVTFPMLVE